MKITHPVTRASFGIAALAAIAILANWLVALTPLGNRGIDFTQNRIHTLSDGTKAILKELEATTVIRSSDTPRASSQSRTASARRRDARRLASSPPAESLWPLSRMRPPARSSR